jgi:uncharacterized protein
MVYFESKGEGNTEKALRIARDEAQKRSVSHVVVASTRGNTGLQAAQLMQNTGVKLVVVGHSTGHIEVGQQLMDMAVKKQIEELGASVHLGTDLLTGFPSMMRKRNRFSEESMIADTLRIFGQGTKVAIEIVAMAFDANLLPVGDVIAVAGTGRGADTCLLVAATGTHQFFDIKVREILAKPRDF